MSAPSGLDVLLAAATTGNGAPPCAQTLGWEAISIEPGRVRIRFQARDAFCNGMGNIQGGFLAAMLDDSMGPALFTELDEGQFAPTLEMKVSFLRAARPGPIVGEGRVAHRTRNVAFLEGTLSTEDGTVLATATATARILSQQSES
jgi:uncharacterized protein (TIGR00369 family)